jgi:phytoene dehydrogenase-like protein
MDPQTIVIGAGHNALTTAFYLARAGLKPLVLERRAIVGGAAVTEEFAPGYRCPLAHATGPLRASIVRDMELERRVEFIRPDPRVVAVSEEGRALTFSRDIDRTVQAIRRVSPADAGKYPEFCATLQRLGRFVEGLLRMTPPSLSAPAAGDVWAALKTGRRFRALDRTDRFRLLRWMPMAVADLVAEWFTTDLLQAAIAARGIFATAQGPWSAGTGAVLLLSAAVDPAPAGSSVMIKGGAGILTGAMADAARQAGAEIRTNIAVARIAVRNGRVSGVTLTDGSELPAQAVISGTDPRRTFLELLDPVELEPGFTTKVRNFRCRGTVAKLHLALGGLPAFRGIANPADLAGRVHVGPSIDYLERAFDASKYGRISDDPYLDIAIPSLHDPSLASPNRHVMSVHIQFAPYKLSNGRSWSDARDTLSRTVLEVLERHAPGLTRLVEHLQVVTPMDLEETYGLSGGHVLHGEMSLDQLFTMRPILGWAQYCTPIGGLFLCGSGTHPGGGITGGSGQNAAREILKALKHSRSSP